VKVVDGKRAFSTTKNIKKKGPQYIVIVAGLFWSLYGIKNPPDGGEIS
jgi:hypothetical protein